MWITGSDFAPIRSNRSETFIELPDFPSSIAPLGAERQTCNLMSSEYLSLLQGAWIELVDVAIDISLLTERIPQSVFFQSFETADSRCIATNSTKSSLPLALISAIIPAERPNCRPGATVCAAPFSDN